MTCQRNENKKRDSEGMSAGQMLFCLMSTVALVLTFVYSDIAVEAMSEGMRLCVATVIPSLFPFMVLSELFVRSGAAALVGKVIGAPVSKLFGISREGSVVWLLGILCGFPVGMRSALSLYEQGKISRAELEHLATFCNGPSSAFLIGAVGSSLLGSQRFGLLLYSMHIAASVIVGFCAKFYFQSKRKEYFLPRDNEKADKTNAASALVDSVTSSAKSMLFICAFIVFFSALIGFLRSFGENAGISGSVLAVTFGFFEMTGGVLEASKLPLDAAIPITAALTGWTGLSVHFQLIGICGQHKFSLWPYFVGKAASSCICAVFVTFFSYVFLEDMDFLGLQSTQSFLVIKSDMTTAFALALFFVSCLAIVKKELRNKF